MAEHRELRNQWLADKSDLETKSFQAQALSTQLNGTIKKKDKDYDKLQAQLAKIIKEASRGNKACIQISAPLQKNLSQSSGSMGYAAGTGTKAGVGLKDADIIALKRHIDSLQVKY